MIRPVLILLLCACSAAPSAAETWSQNMSTAVREGNQLGQLDLWRQRHQAASGLDPVALVGLGRALVQQGQLDVALRVLEAGDRRLGGRSGPVALELGRTERLLGQGVRAVAALERATVAPDRPEGAWYELARAQLEAGLNDEAARSAVRAAREAPHSVESLDLLVGCSALTGDTEQEYAGLVRRMGLGGMDVSGLLRLAQLGLGSEAQGPRDGERAWAALRRAVGKDPQSVQANRMLGQIIAGRGEHVQAVRYFERAAELDPGNRVLMLELAGCLRSAGQEERADQMQRHAETLQGPND